MMTTDRAADESVTVVIPTYNRAQWLSAAVASVRAQAIAALCIVVVDDGSTDTTSQVCATLAGADARVRIVRQANRGPAAARNAGLEHADTRWIAFLDDDDLLTPGALAALLAFAFTTRSAVVAGRAATFVTEEPTSPAAILAEPGRFVLSEWPPDLPPSPHLTPEELVLRPQVGIDCGLFAVSAVRDCGGFREDPTIPEDYDLWLRLAAAAPIPVLDQRVTLIRLHAAQRSRPLGNQAASTRAVLESFLASHPDVARRIGRRAIAARLGHLCQEEAYAALLERRRRDACRAALLSLRHRPWTGKNWAYLALAPFPRAYALLRGLSADRQRRMATPQHPELLGNDRKRSRESR